MNERIKELYRQAHSIRYHDGDPMRHGNPPTVYWEGEVSAQRFAELIVRECAELSVTSQYANTKSEYYDGFNEALIYAGNKIKQHFGVE